MVKPHMGRHPEIPCIKCDRDIINDDTCRGDPHSRSLQRDHGAIAFHPSRSTTGSEVQAKWETSSQPVLALLTSQSIRPSSTIEGSLE